jgi:hypothetical protein
VIQTQTSSRSEREPLQTPAAYGSSDRVGQARAVPDDWRRIEDGLFESADGQWRIANPRKVTTELRHRWLVAERSVSGAGWCMHVGDHATLQDARVYVEALGDLTPATRSAGS